MEKNIVCIGIPVFGHLLPMVQLARQLSQHHNVTFASPAHALDGLRKRGAFEGSNAKLHLFDIQDGVKDEAEFYQNMFKCLLMGFGALNNFIGSLADGSALKSDGKPFPATDFIIDDITGSSTLKAIEETKLPFYLLNCGRAFHTALAVLLMDEHPVLVPYDKAPTFLELPGPDGKLHGPLAEEMYNLFFVHSKRALPRTKGIILNSIQEFDAATIGQIAEQPGMNGIPVYSIFPLLQSTESASKGNTEVAEKLKTWLDGKAEKSTVYVAFGSVYGFTPEQLMELGDALLQLNRPVIWSLKEKDHGSLSETVREAMKDPEGLLQFLSWAPQKFVLLHPSVGLFVSHCGWSSTMEGLSAGQPFVCWPLRSDQMMNAWFLEEQGAGVLIRGKDTELVTREVIVKTVETVLEKGSPYAAKAKILQAQVINAFQPTGSVHADYQKLLDSFQ